MKILFWVLFAVALLEGAYLIYHFATYEHKTLPAEPTQVAYAESLHVYQARVAELEQDAAQARDRLDQVGKSQWPSVHLRLETADQEIEHLRSVMKRWEEKHSPEGMDELYHEVVAVYGRAAGLVLAASYDTLLEPEGVTEPKGKTAKKAPR
jgi:cytochrome c-type biogenesis protein CcmH/NrfG